MQEYFLDFFDRDLSPVPELVENTRRVRAACVAMGVPVIYTAQPPVQSAADRGLLQDMWGSGITAHPQSTSIVQELRPSRADHVLVKWRYSAFRRSALSDLLSSLGRDQMVVCGVYAHIGCLMTAAEAFMQDIQAFIVGDAVADFCQEEHLMALSYVARRCGVCISTDAAVQALSQGPLRSVEGLGTLGLALRERVATLIGTEESELGTTDNLFDHGLDSVRLLDLVAELQIANPGVSFVALAEQPTLAAWESIMA